MNQKYFAPQHHIPKFSRLMFEALLTPLLAYFAVAGNFFMFSSAYIFYVLEVDVNKNVSSYSDALWWALCTISTVGYGDVVPVTGYGRLISAFLIVVGVTFFLGFMAVLVSVMSSWMVDDRWKT